MKLEEQIGQQLMVGIPGTEVTPGVLKLFEEIHPGGVIFYRPNFISARAFRSLVTDLENASGKKLLMAVDHEGGRVIHLAEGVTVFPDNLALGRTKKPFYAEEQGRIEALELRRLGIDLNLAPTLDVLTETFSPNIGIRSYAVDPNLVARLGVARIKAMQGGGISACAKHFPGQGHSPLDAHLKLPVLPTTWKEMESIHIKPFRAAIEAGVDAVMSSHPVYINLDPAPMCPATFSKRIIRSYLRNDLGFEGLILSDDLEMGALKEMGSIGEAACRAVEAGHDMLLVCHSPSAQREVFHSLVRAYRDKRLDAGELEKSLERIEIIRQKRRKRFGKGEPVQESDGASLAQKIAREAVCVSKNRSDRAALFSESRSPSVSVIFPRLSELSRQVLIEESMLDEEDFVRSVFGQFGVHPSTVQIVALDPQDSEIEKAASAAGSSGITVFFCYDAHLFPKTRRLLQVLQKSARDCVVVLLRDPYDEEFVEENTVCVNAFGFRGVQIKAAVECIFSRSMSMTVS